MGKEKTRIQQLAEECTERWGSDNKTSNFSNKLGKFVSQLNGNKEIGEILLELVKHYNYYSHAKVIEIFDSFHKIIKEDMNCNYNMTIYSVLEGGKKLNSSNTLLEDFRIHCEIPSDYGYSIDSLSLEDLEYIENIIFFDDIIGSGKTVRDFFEKYSEKLKNVRAYIFCIEIMSEAHELLIEYFKSNSYDCEIFYHNMSFKAFDDGVIYDEDCKFKEQALKMFEESFWNKGNRNILGFDNSQAIVSFFRNTPNNTISSFWVDRDEWKGLFIRNNEKPLFKRRDRKNILMNLKKMEFIKDE